MKQFLITVAGVLVGLILFIVVVPMVLISSLASSASSRHAESMPKAIVLGLDLREPVTDGPSTSPFHFDGGTSVIDIVEKLQAGSTDDKVKGLYVRAATSGIAPAHAEEIRDAIAKFRAAGKFVVAHIQNDGVRTSIFGYVATAGADELWLQDASEMMPMGITAEETFFADTLKRFHATAQFETREEYKTFADQFTQSGFTPANRESTTSLLTSLYDRAIVAIAESRKDRGLTPALVRAAIEATPYSGEDALARKLVDKLGRPEDAQLAAIERGGGVDTADIVELGKYEPKSSDGPVIALVGGEGAIVTGVDESSPFSDEPMMNGDAIAEAILDAADDEDVKAIVFRVSSPGGSVVGSDQIWHAVETAQARGKKVVVSMGAYAASGGYYVSAGADEIVAWPSTITGSIGVVGGKIVIGDAMRHYLSTRTETIQVGSPVANFFTSDHAFNQAERAAFVGFIDRSYADFIKLVAEGRGMTPEQARAVAKGRVWTGAQAHELKLVNTFGGLAVAVERAKALADIKAETAVTLRHFPEEKNPFEAIQELFGMSAQGARAAAVLGGVLGDERISRALREAMDDRRNVRAETSIEVR
ncbi:MAG: S49 family peptidase [Hyphomonadaceae bacterium]|nr:MAG: protease IV [Caulobacteraceae bacterium]MBT9445438.1 S49 family peptidase [Hyphomonadaceae bacterium]TPW06985.1 MAG: protease IV [Alphaproteobacteria bacterium]